MSQSHPLPIWPFVLVLLALVACERRRHDVATGRLRERLRDAFADAWDRRAAEASPPHDAEPSKPTAIQASPDPAPRLAPAQPPRMDVLLGSAEQTRGTGAIDLGAVERIIRGQLGGMRACHERASAERSAVPGRQQLTFTIGRRGRAERIFSEGSLAAADACVAARMRGLAFPVPVGGEVEVTLSLVFSPAP